LSCPARFYFLFFKDSLIEKDFFLNWKRDKIFFFLFCRAGLGHQTAASSLAISLPAIHFQSDAEIDGLRRRPRAAALKAATGSASRRGNSVDDVDADEDDEDDASLVNRYILL